MYQYSYELNGLDKELEKYTKELNKFKPLIAIKLIKRVRTGISIKDKNLFVGIPNMDRYIFLRWLNTNALFCWAIFMGIKRYQYEINNIRLFVKFHDDKKLIEEAF
tara:strand:+ start:532 stop:849 length:318 start_codon:yes stop_codon:yes gene_type:complete